MPTSPLIPQLPPDTTVTPARVSGAVAVLLIVPLVLALLAGCTSVAERSAQKQARECPRAATLLNADKLAVFDNMKNPSRETVTVNARLAGYNYGCRAVPKKGALEVHLTLSFRAERTTLAGNMKGLSLPYFVAIIDKNGNIVERQRKKVRLTFGDQDSSTADRIKKSPNVALVDEDIVLMVQGQDAADAQAHRITFGFELVPAQVRYNQGDADLTAPLSNNRKG